MSAINVTTDNFEREVLQAEQTVLVDFWASWCGPCKMLSPIIDEVSEERTDVRVCKVNVDEEPDLAVKYKVMSIPMVVAFRNGEVYKKSVGAVPKSAILELLD